MACLFEECIVPKFARYLSSKNQLKLHFEAIKQMENIEPIVLLPQTVRLDFILYCVDQSNNFSPDIDEISILDNYLEQQSQAPYSSLILEDSRGIESPQTAEDLNRKKLAALFSHLSAFTYKLGDLNIEQVQPADLIQKLQEINKMTDSEAQEYLYQLIGDKIPEYDQLPMQDFLTGVQKCYQNEGINFHCYLRENFFNPLKASDIKKAAPILNYFMPTVFTQQHINSCSIATTMTMLKKVATNFNQMQAICFVKNTTLPTEVIASQSKIKALEQQFESFLKTPFTVNKKDVQNILNEYRKEVEIVQIEMEKALARLSGTETELHVKKYKNHTLATVKHLVTTLNIPDGIKVNSHILKRETKSLLTSFQHGILTQHLTTIQKNTIVENLHNDQIDPDDKDFYLYTIQKDFYLYTIKKLFLDGKSKASTENCICGHSLIMDVDETGTLKIIEHKNGKTEETILSKDGFRDIGIKSSHYKESNAVQTTLANINHRIKILLMEKVNILKVRLGIKSDSAIYSEMNTLLAKKDGEIEDLIDLRRDLLIKYKIPEEQDSLSPFVKDLTAPKNVDGFFSRNSSTIITTAGIVLVALAVGVGLAFGGILPFALAAAAAGAILGAAAIGYSLFKAGQAISNWINSKNGESISEPSSDLNKEQSSEPKITHSYSHLSTLGPNVPQDMNDDKLEHHQQPTPEKPDTGVLGQKQPLESNGTTNTVKP